MISGSKFTFTRFSYHSGDWDTDLRMTSNLLNSLLEYTTVPIDPHEKVIPLSSNDICSYPFAYISGH